MGLRSIAVCWTFLDSVTETLSPKALIDCFDALRTTAIVQNVDLSIGRWSQIATEVKVRERMLETLKVPTGRKSKSLPAIGLSLVLNKETWHIKLSGTAIPHISASVVESLQPGPETVYRFHLVSRLIDRGIIDCGRIADKQLYGRTWSLYLLCKIRNLRRLHKMFTFDPHLGLAQLAPPDHRFPEIVDKLQPMSRVSEEKQHMRTFMDECDEVLIDLIGEKGMASYLKHAPITVTQFLHAR